MKLGFWMSNGRYANTEDIELIPSATRTQSGDGPRIEMGARTTLRLALDVAAVNGTTPTLEVIVETSHDGAAWRTVGAFTAVTTVGSERKSFVGCDRLVRPRWTMGGTAPSFWFRVSGEAA